MRSQSESASPFMFGQVPITIERPAYAAARGHVVARVGIGPNWHTAEGKTPERAAKWLRVRLAGLFAYGDTVQRGGTYAQASIAQRKARRAQMAREIEPGSRNPSGGRKNCGGVGRKLVPPGAEAQS
jgi:hypothetical protein